MNPKTLILKLREKKEGLEDQVLELDKEILQTNCRYSNNYQVLVKELAINKVALEELKNMNMDTKFVEENIEEIKLRLEFIDKIEELTKTEALLNKLEHQFKEVVSEIERENSIKEATEFLNEDNKSLE